MASTYSDSLRFELPADGDRSGTWGQMLDLFMGTLLEDAILGVVSVVMTDANKTLSTASGAVDEARNFILICTGTLSATRNVIAPAKQKTYIVHNATTGGQAIQIIGTSGTGVTVENGDKALVYFDGANFVSAIDLTLPPGLVTETGTQTLTNKTIVITDTNFTVTDNADVTKLFKVEVSAVAAGQTRTWSVPDFSDVFVGLAGAQTLQNKTLDNTTTINVKDTLLRVQDDAAPTKLFGFDAAAITAGQTRIMTVPDGDVALSASLTNAQTGTTYTVLTTDRTKYLTFSNASAVAVTHPAAGSAGFPAGWFAWYQNIGAGLVTITASINGGTALTLRQWEWALLVSNGATYQGLTSGQITGLPLVREIGTRGVPVNQQDATYGFVLSDAGGCVYHASASTHTYTIPANATVAFPIGTAITVANGAGGGNVTIAITSDTLQRGDGTAGTGSRTVAASSVVTLLKVLSTTWMIMGTFT